MSHARAGAPPKAASSGPISARSPGLNPSRLGRGTPAGVCMLATACMEFCASAIMEFIYEKSARRHM